MKYTHFSKEERLELSILLSKKYSLRSIAKAMDRSHSSIGREIKRNGVKGAYDGKKADTRARIKRRHSKYQGMKVIENSEIKEYIIEKMENEWSPENIAGRFNFEKGKKMIGKDAIYKYLYSAYGNGLCRFLRYKRFRKVKRSGLKGSRAMIKDRIFIDERPAIVNERARFGDFEGDTMGRPKKASPETLVVARERLSRKMFAVKVKKLKYSIKGFKKILKNTEAKSLTLDNGVENTRFEELKIRTYFCHPYHSWEKGTVEQGILVIRSHIPKKADLKNFSQKEIDAILKKINSTPMKCLDFKTPDEVYQQHISLTGHRWCT